MPSMIATHPVPVSTSNDVPILRGYFYTMLDSDKLLIVDPNTHKVVDVISY